MLSLLIENGTYFSQVDNSNYTSLHYASEIGSYEMVDLLVFNGAIPTSTDGISFSFFNFFLIGHHFILQHSLDMSLLLIYSLNTNLT